jgi:tetratricopeptide (TPR) repeat protein
MSALISPGGPIADSLSQANQELEKVWETVFSLSAIASTSDDSCVACRRIICYNPSNPNIERVSQHFRTAIDYLCEVVTTRATQLQSDNCNPEHYIVIGHCYLILNDFINAYTSYSHVLRLGTAIDSAYFHYGFGSVLHYFKYNRDANEHLHEALRLGGARFPARADLQLRIALTQRALGAYDAAISSFKEIVSSPPAALTSDDIDFQIAYTCQLASRGDNAGQIYAELHKRHPSTLELVQQYCWFLSLQYDKQSLEKAERIIAASGLAGDPLLKLITARIAMKQHDMTLAYQKYCDCIAFWTDSPLFWCGLGVLYFKNDQMQDAIVAFQRALYLKPELVEPWANLGLIFELRKEPTMALSVYQQAIDNCNEKDAKPIRERLALIGNGRHRQATPGNIMEFNDSPFFVQVAERLAGEYVANSPVIPAALIGGDDALDKILPELTLPHKSIF